MNRTTVVASGLLIVGTVLVLMARGCSPVEPAAPDVSKPPEVAVADAERWMRQLEKPGKVVFRTEGTVDARSLSSDLASREVETLGRLDDGAERAVVADFESQRMSLDTKIANLKGTASRDPLDELRSALDASELVLEKVRRDIMIDMITHRDYATIKSQAARPPEVEGYDRIVHGPVSQIGKEPVDVVLYIPLNDSRLKDSREYWGTLYWEYWEKYVANFNSQDLAVRKAQIARHYEAMKQKANPVAQGLSPGEIQDATIKGPVGIDDGKHVLILRR